jgi:ribulose-phosphate 3-epimerase
MGILVPAILPKSRSDLIDRLSRLSGLAANVQIDVVDGRFATPPTWPYTEGDGTCSENLHDFGDFRYEVDLMVANPEQVVGSWIRAGATRLTLHAESSFRFPALIKELRDVYGYDKDFAPDLLSVGLALNIGTDLALLEAYIPEVDYVQLMGIRTIGRQGEPFDPEVLRRIRTLHARYPKLGIQIDGGVSLKTAPDLLSMGATRLVVGSDLWRASSLQDQMLKYEELGERYGLYH